MASTALETLTHVFTEEPVVGLTFDDGPDPVNTPRLLDILAAHHARATFFMIGVRAQRHAKLVSRVAAEGHAIGNHSWDHPSFPMISQEERREQVRGCARAIAPYAGLLFRPPYGHQDLASWLDVDQMGYRVVAWKIAAGDWEQKDGPAMADAVMAKLQPGAIVLLHDGLFDAPDSRFFGAILWFPLWSFCWLVSLAAGGSLPFLNCFVVAHHSASNGTSLKKRMS